MKLSKSTLLFCLILLITLTSCRDQLRSGIYMNDNTHSIFHSLEIDLALMQAKIYLNNASAYDNGQFLANQFIEANITEENGSFYLTNIVSDFLTPVKTIRFNQAGSKRIELNCNQLTEAITGSSKCETEVLQFTIKQ